MLAQAVVRVLDVEASFGRRSARPGERVSLSVLSDAPWLRLTLLRCGGESEPTNSNSIMNGVPVGTPQRLDLRGHRDKPFSFAVQLPPELTTGVHCARLDGPAGHLGFAPIVIRPATPTQRVAVVMPTTTSQAYNFYDENGDGFGGTWYALWAQKRVDVTRPHLRRGVPYRWRSYDLQFQRWLASRGHAVDTYADEDIELFRTPEQLRAAYDLIIFPGHTEYVTSRLFDLIEGFRNLGGRLIFLSANNFFREVVREDSHVRLITEWRNKGRPEASLLGAQYIANDRGARQKPFTVTGADVAPWAFANTGLSNGSNFGLYGIEIDATNPASPPGTQVLARIPDLFGPGRSAEMTYYETSRRRPGVLGRRPQLRGHRHALEQRRRDPRQRLGAHAHSLTLDRRGRFRTLTAAPVGESGGVPRDLPSGTVTFMFTDIEGSTRLLHELGGGYADVLVAHRQIVREVIAAHRGVEVDTQGDAFFVAFMRASDAATAAADIQQALQRGPVSIRIGLHTGEPTVADEGYVGIDVHRAARIMSAAHGGQVVLSAQTHSLLDGSPRVRDLGEHRLKDMGAPERLYQLGDASFPPLRTLDATNLPTRVNPLLGRERELEELVQLVEDARLVTVIGPGGIGKTRLALQVAAELVGRFHDGVFWVPLAGLGDPSLVVPEIAQAVGAQGDLAGFVRGRDLLLLLDNFEHVLSAAAEVHDLLSLSDRLRLLVTSRGPLRRSGEHQYRLEPLEAAGAAELFVARAEQAGGADAAPETVDAICARLDRLPLAIELAAARTGLLSGDGLLRRLDRTLPLADDGGARRARAAAHAPRDNRMEPRSPRCAHARGVRPLRGLRRVLLAGRSRARLRRLARRNRAPCRRESRQGGRRRAPLVVGHDP